MELIFVFAKFLQYIFVAPVWWVSSQLASVFYPFEGDNKHSGLTLLFTTIISIAAILLLIFLL